MDKEFAGQPLWIWLVGAVVVVGGYLYLTHGKSSSAGTASSGTTPDKSTSTISETIKDLQSNPKPVKKPPKKDPGK